MRNKYAQMSLMDIYHDVAASLEEDKPKLFRMMHSFRRGSTWRSTSG